jgi:hypothetical protein
MSETRKIAAILAIDVVGYSRLMGEGGRNGAGALATRTVHRRWILRPRMSRFPP